MTSFFKNSIKSIISLFYLRLGFVQLAMYYIRANNQIISVYFHNPSKSTFENCLIWLKNKGYNFISTTDLLNINNGSLIQPKNAVIITVDDGWHDNYNNVIPISLKLNIPVTIFITTEPVEFGGGYWWSYIKNSPKEKIINTSVLALKKSVNSKRIKFVNEIKALVNIERQAMTIDQLRIISNNPLITLGSHTITHPILPNCTDVEAQSEIAGSKLILEKWLDREIHSFSYPNGDFGNREINLLNKAGYQLGFSTIPALINMHQYNNLFTIPRFEVLDNASLNENICRMTGVWYKINFKNLYNINGA